MVQGAVDVDIGANPSAEGGEDEGVDDQAIKVVDIVDTFRLQVCFLFGFILLLFIVQVVCWKLLQSVSFFECGMLVFLSSFPAVADAEKGLFVFWQEQPAFDKKQFVTFMKRYIKSLTPKLEPEKQEEFKKNIEGATKFLLSKLKDLQL